MFRIDRTQVNLSSTWYVKVSEEDEAAVCGPGEETGAETEMSARGQALSDGGQAPSREQDEAASEAVLARAGEILDKAEAAAKEEAGKILDDAREEASGIIFDAREQAKEERRQAAEEGFAEGNADGLKKGYEEGLARGAEEGRKDFDEKIEEDDRKLRGLFDDVYEAMEASQAELEDGVAGLALDIVRKVIDPTDAANGVFVSMIRNALRQIRTDRKIVIRVGPDVLKRFFPTGSADFELDGGAPVKATVLEDQTLGEGGVVIDAGEETINAGLETQLRNLEIAFERADV